MVQACSGKSSIPSLQVLRLKVLLTIVLLSHDFEIKRYPFYPCVYDPHMLVAPFSVSRHQLSRNAAINIVTNTSHAEQCQKAHNKAQHMKNGNKKAGTFVKNLTLMTFNKGSSWYPKHRDMIINLIQNEKPLICCITESCFRPDEKFLATDFPNYKFEHKFLPGLGYARVTMMIHTSVEYTRLHNMEDDMLSTIWLKIKTSKKGYMYTMGIYREHRYPKEMGIQCSEKKQRQIERFQRIIQQIKSIKQNKILMIGDVNCDMLESNNSMGRHDIKEMIQHYTEFLEDNKFTLMNKKATRDWAGVPSALIDHIITNQPLHINNVVAKPTHISNHEMVFCN